jgi:RNA polymerase sigma factor (TIGR02999 family)
LFGSAEAVYENRAHFFGAAGEAMRRVLVDLARRRQAAKRGGEARRVELSDETASDDQATMILSVDEALKDLAAYDDRKRQLVELRFFAGLTLEEAAETLGVSLATAKRDWSFAKAWLFRALGDCTESLTRDG